ncbi:uncharacterized protein LOC125198650 [Salvia hispanica]|uniref:uncharacterized protein LOC125198650 n=1 Tax=Salvia hispanica TaxID=49212 RepID=UPI002009D40A|nr:uncharacterized protein LOC125198650 [Salvia hispanica]
MDHQILEINLISAQGLKPPPSNLRKMQTYAVTWVNPASKLRTRVDSLGGENPTWNDKFLFRVSDHFLSGDTSAVSVHIFAVGYITDVLIGTIRRPSGRFLGALNIAAAVYYSADYPILDKLSAVSFRALTEKKARLSRGGDSRRSNQSSCGDSCDLSDADSTVSSSSASSPAAASTALREWNSVREMAGKLKGAKSNGGGLLCGLMLARKIPSCPSNLDTWRGKDEGSR